MKIKKSELKKLVENYLFEEEKKSLQNSQNYTGGKGMKGEQLRTKDVKFKWGSYKGKHANEKYVILQGEKDLGDFQKKGDPFTYKKLPNGKHKVISGPAKFDSSIGKSITVKGKEAFGKGEKGKKGKTVEIISNVESALQFSNISKINELIKKRNTLVAKFKNAEGSFEVKDNKKEKSISYKSRIESSTGEKPGVVPSTIGQSTYKHPSFGNDFKEYDNTIKQIVPELQNLMKELYDKLNKSFDNIYAATTTNVKEEDIIKALNACKDFLVLYYAIHNSVCFKQYNKIKKPISITDKTPEIALARLMDKPYGKNVSEGTVYMTFYQVFLTVNKLIKEKNQEKIGEELVSLIQKNNETMTDFNIF